MHVGPRPCSDVSYSVCDEITGPTIVADCGRSGPIVSLHKLITIFIILLECVCVCVCVCMCVCTSVCSCSSKNGKRSFTQCILVHRYKGVLIYLCEQKIQWAKRN